MVLNWVNYPATMNEVTHPNNLVYAHVTIKGLQAGLVLGSVAAIARNLYGMYYTKADQVFNWERIARYSRNGVIPLIVLINLKCCQMLAESSLEKNQSRAFRIFKNQGQNLSDDLTLGGVLGGLAYAAIKKQKSIGQIAISASIGGLVGLLIDFGVVAVRGISGSKH